MSNEYESTIRELQTSLMRCQEENTKLQEQCQIWMKTAQQSSVDGFHAKEQIISYRRCIEDIQAAIVVEGPVPQYHRHVVRKHRSEWPTLWKAIDRAIQKINAV